jgi:hypothetical protein
MRTAKRGLEEEDPRAESEVTRRKDGEQEEPKPLVKKVEGKRRASKAVACTQCRSKKRELVFVGHRQA